VAACRARSFLSEVERPSILRTGLAVAPSLSYRLATRLAAHAPPRSGPERSDFVLWRNLRIQSKTAFSRFPPVHRTGLEGPILTALIRISLKFGVVGEGGPATGSIQSTASTSSLKRASPLVHRATNEAMTYCVRMRSTSRSIASTCRLKATISASTPTSSLSSRATANAAHPSQFVTPA
jgi:hypothetical protein